MLNQEPLKLSIVVPVYNEQEIIEQVLSDLKREVSKLSLEYEIIVVDDGSKDRSGEILVSIDGVKVISHPYNKGYGASLKTGASISEHDWILFFDADGQHRPEYVGEFLTYIQDYDMIVGARSGYLGPIIRQPGKKILKWLASYLVDFKIPDLNCGLRMIKRSLFDKYAHLCPGGFSISTTLNMTFLKEGLNIKFVPIQINKRTGRSTVRPRHALEALVLIIRLITLFSPMRFFVPVALVFFLAAFGFLIYDIVHSNLSNTTVVFFISAVLLFFFGLILDQLAAIRRELNRK